MAANWRFRGGQGSVHASVGRTPIKSGRLGPLAFLIVLELVTPASAASTSPTADPKRLEQRIKALSQFGANPEGGVSRVAFSDADLAGREYIKGLMREAGLLVTVDTAGNILGRREGRDRRLPAILFGSHIDSVPGGGNYDGDLGVIGGIEVAQLLQDHKVETRHPLEVVVFTDEEGSMVGSLAMTGRRQDVSLGVVSHSGQTIRDGIRRVGGDPDRLGLACRKPGDVEAFIELHIEQGAVLHEEGIPIGVVEGIVGIRWWEVVVEGVANHAGTTGMNRRRDALLSASELALAVNRVATTLSGRQVATVGQIRAEPGAPNVIPGRVVMSLEIRDLAAEKIQEVFDAVAAEAGRIAAARQTPIHFRESFSVAPAPTAERMRQIIAASAKDLGLRYKLMPSGAGHDAQDMTHIAPTGMVFVPSVLGVSHSPKEYTSPEDMANGANVLLRTVMAVDGGALK
jgi:N-carbamoyl-L-amino-acid hydrolase